MHDEMPLGEITILKRIHGSALNTLIVPFGAPEDWCFVQFPTLEMAQDFAVEHKLIIKMEQE